MSNSLIFQYIFKNVYKIYLKQDFRFFSQNFLSESLISSERPERIAQGRSFVLSDLSNPLTVTYFLWLTWAIPSRLLISYERPEWFAHGCAFPLSNLSDSLTVAD